MGAAQHFIEYIIKDRNEFSTFLVFGLAHRIRTRLQKAQATMEKYSVIHDSLNYESQQLAELVKDLDNLIRNGDLKKHEAVRNLKLTPDKISFGIHEVVSEIVRHFQGPLSDLKIEITIDIDTDLKITSDRESVFQILYELMMNAIKSVTKSSQANHIVLIHAHETRDAVSLTISDSGQGMSLEEQNRTQSILQGQLKEEVCSGVGLMICRHHIQKLGYQMNFSSRPLYGSSFQIIIPNQPSPSASSK
ncbi:MAG: sensor histidine kinase [Pseudobdellovibrionaceae bacterium]